MRTIYQCAREHNISVLETNRGNVAGCLHITRIFVMSFFIRLYPWTSAGPRAARDCGGTGDALAAPQLPCTRERPQKCRKEETGIRCGRNKVGRARQPAEPDAAQPRSRAGRMSSAGIVSSWRRQPRKDSTAWRSSMLPAAITGLTLIRAGVDRMGADSAGLAGAVFGGVAGGFRRRSRRIRLSFFNTWRLRQVARMPPWQSGRRLWSSGHALASNADSAREF
jgi:hypothetical protein